MTMTPVHGQDSNINCFRCKEVPLRWGEYETGTYGLFCTQKYCNMVVKLPFLGVLEVDHPIVDTWTPEELLAHYNEIIKEFHPAITTRKSDQETETILQKGNELADKMA